MEQLSPNYNSNLIYSLKLICDFREIWWSLWLRMSSGTSLRAFIPQETLRLHFRGPHMDILLPILEDFRQMSQEARTNHLKEIAMALVVRKVSKVQTECWKFCKNPRETHVCPSEDGPKDPCPPCSVILQKSLTCGNSQLYERKSVPNVLPKCLQSCIRPRNCGHPCGRVCGEACVNCGSKCEVECSPCPVSSSTGSTSDLSRNLIIFFI